MIFNRTFLSCLGIALGRVQRITQWILPAMWRLCCYCCRWRAPGEPSTGDGSNSIRSWGEEEEEEERLGMSCCCLLLRQVELQARG